MLIQILSIILISLLLTGFELAYFYLIQLKGKRI